MNNLWVMMVVVVSFVQHQAVGEAFVSHALRRDGARVMSKGWKQVGRGVRQPFRRNGISVVDTTSLWRGEQKRKRGSKFMVMEAEGRNLFDCIRDEDVESVRTYVERGGPVHVADALGDTSLFVAASTGNVDLIKVLASAEDSDVNYPCFHGGETPLMVACTRGDLGVVEFLVNEVGANVNAMNHRGDTALSLAAFWGKVDCVEFLLGLPNIDTEIQNVQGKRAGEGMQELMRDDSHDEEVVALLKQSRVDQGITRL